MPATPITTSLWGVEDWSSVLIQALTQQSVLLNSGVTRVLCSGRVIHIPRLIALPKAAWTAELAEIPSDSGTQDELVLSPLKLADVITISNEAIMDSSVDMLNTVGDALTKGVAISLDETAFSTAAATPTSPAGLLNGALPSVTGGVTIDNIISAAGLIGAAGGVADSVYLNAQDLTALRLAKDAQGRPLLQPDLQAAGAETVAGARLYPTPGMAAGTALVAMAKYIVVAVRQDASVAFSSDAIFSSDGVLSRVVMRASFAVSDPHATCVVGA